MFFFLLFFCFFLIFLVFSSVFFFFWLFGVKFVSPGCEGVALCIQECGPCIREWEPGSA